MVVYKANVFEVKAKLSDFLNRAARGERIVICRHNKPVAELRPVDEARTEPRPIGPLSGRPSFDVPPSFFEPMADKELNRWEAVMPGDPLSTTWTPSRPVAGASKVAETKGAVYGRRRRRGSARRRS